MGVPTLAYIDGGLIDELWMLLKRDGVPTERLNKAKAAVSGKVSYSLGAGHLVSWLIGDLKGEAGGQLDGEETVKTTYAAPARLLLIQELLSSIRYAKLEQHDAIAHLTVNDFVDIECPALSLTLLPRYGDYAHICMANELAEERSGHDDVTPRDRYELVAKHVEKFSTQSTAFSFWLACKGKIQIRARSLDL